MFSTITVESGDDCSELPSINVVVGRRQVDGPLSDNYSARRSSTNPGNTEIAKAPVFKHTPLDLERRSIRIVRIHQESTSDDGIRCEMRHTELRYRPHYDPYTCLSYVWGNAGQGDWILLNNQRFWVRRNLHSFLRWARRIPEVQSRWLWIDALSIDQDTGDERNHQVQQMGDIYSKSVQVISWFGESESIAHFLAHTNSHTMEKVGRKDFFESEYWQRAWITQEVVLGREVIFMARDTMLWESQMYFPEAWALRHSDCYPLLLRDLKGTSLPYILGQMKHKRCTERQDGIFSILALCDEGPGISVDYGMPVEELAKSILRACKKSFCLCSMYNILSALELNHTTQPASPDPASTLQRIIAGPIFAQINVVRFNAAVDFWGFRMESMDALQQAKSQGVVWLSRSEGIPETKTVSSLIIKIQHLCSSYSGAEWITFRVNSAREAYNFRVEQEFPNIQLTELVVPPDDFKYTVYLSLEMLYEISCLQQGRPGSCSNGKGNGNALRSYSILQMI